MIRRTIKVLPIPDRVLKIENSWEKNLQVKEFENKLKFLNKTKRKYDWDNGNEEFDEDEALLEDETPYLLVSRYSCINPRSGFRI